MNFCRANKMKMIMMETMIMMTMTLMTAITINGNDVDDYNDDGMK